MTDRGAAPAAVCPSPERGRIRVTPLAQADAEAVRAMVHRCSRTTLFRRFHGVSDASVYLRLLLDRRAQQDSLVAIHDSRCIGIASVAASGDGTSHLGVLVEDRWQHRRVGTRLVGALVERARTRGDVAFVADVLDESRFVIAPLKRIGPLEVVFDHGVYSVRVDLAGRRSTPGR